MTQAGNEYDGAAVAHAAMLIKYLTNAPARKTVLAVICEMEALLQGLETGRWCSFRVSLLIQLVIPEYHF